MKNSRELREEMINLFNQVKNDEIDLKKAKALVGVSNVVLKTAALEMQHNKLFHVRRPVDFLKQELPEKELNPKYLTEKK